MALRACINAAEHTRLWLLYLVQSKALRERWLLDGAPSAGSEEDEAKRQLQEDEAKTKGLEETILRSSK